MGLHRMTWEILGRKLDMGGIDSGGFRNQDNPARLKITGKKNKARKITKSRASLDPLLMKTRSGQSRSGTPSLCQ